MLGPDPVAADPGTVTVVGGGTYGTIQEAVNAASDGATIEIGAGEYPDPIQIAKTLTIRAVAEGDSYERVVINTTMEVGANGVKIEGLHFKGIYDNSTEHDWDFGGIVTRQVTGSEATDSLISDLGVSNCRFTDCRQGIFLFGAKHCWVNNCTFTNNYRGVSIVPHRIDDFTQTCHDNSVVDCYFSGQYGNGSKDGEAVAIHSSNDCIVQTCIMDQNSYGVVIGGGGGNQVLNNDITGSYYDAIVLNNTNGSIVEGNGISDNNGDVVVKGSNNTTIQENRFVGSTLVLEGSTRSHVNGNSFEKSEAPSVRVTGTGRDHFDHEFDALNKIYEEREGSEPTGHIIYIFNSSVGQKVTYPSAGAILVAYSEKVSIVGSTVEDGDGIWFHRSKDCSIVDSTVDDCLYGIELERSEDIKVRGTVVSTTPRSWQAVHAVGGSSHVFDSDVQTPSYAPAFKLEGGAKVSTYNTTFNDSKVNVVDTGTLRVYNPLTVKAWQAGRTGPFPGVHLKVTRDNNVVYATSHFGGSDAVTDADGMAGTESNPIYLLDHEFIDSNEQRNHQHDLEVYAKVTAEWSDEESDMDMSGPLHLEFEVDDIGSPPTPMDIQLKDLPDQDSIEISWDDVGGGVTLYSIYWNGTGEWDILANVSAPQTSYRVEASLEDGRTYFFSISSWDAVPLESPRSSPKSVRHRIDNHRPGLTNGTVDPDTGNTRTDFRFSVVFTDADGDEGTVWVVIDGERREMRGDPSDTDPTDGRLYTYGTKLRKGNHTYHFEAEDSGGINATGPSAGPDEQKSIADVRKAPSADSPGASAGTALIGMAAIATIIIGSRRRRKG